MLLLLPDRQNVFEKLLHAAANSEKFNTGDGFVEPGAKVFVEHVHNLFQQFDQVTANPAEFLSGGIPERRKEKAAYS